MTIAVMIAAAGRNSSRLRRADLYLDFPQPSSGQNPMRNTSASSTGPHVLSKKLRSMTIFVPPNASTIRGRIVPASINRTRTTRMIFVSRKEPSLENNETGFSASPNFPRLTYSNISEPTVITTIAARIYGGKGDP